MRGREEERIGEMGGKVKGEREREESERGIMEESKR